MTSVYFKLIPSGKYSKVVGETVADDCYFPSVSVLVQRMNVTELEVNRTVRDHIPRFPLFCSSQYEAGEVKTLNGDTLYSFEEDTCPYHPDDSLT